MSLQSLDSAAEATITQQAQSTPLIQIIAPTRRIVVIPDSSGRVKTATYTEDGTNYAFGYAYNTFGALDTLTSPSSTGSTPFQLKYVYDAYGFLNQTKDAVAGTAFWTLNSATAAARRRASRSVMA